MASLQGHTDFAVGLEAANPGPMASARVDDHERPSRPIDDDTFGWNDPREDVIDGPVKSAAINDELGVVIQDMRSKLGNMLVILIASLPQHVPEKDAALAGIDQVINRVVENGQRSHWTHALIQL
jgi:hypothetical protein